MSLKYEAIVTGPLQENCYLVWDTDTMEGIFIDPGADAPKLLKAAAFHKVKVVGIYNTHAHIDHVGAVSAIVEELGVPFALHKAETQVLGALPMQASMFGLGSPGKPPKVDIQLEPDSEIQVGNLRGKVLFTPGHTPGGICFLFNNKVFVGDTLFSGSIGRSDLPGGNGRQLVNSIHTQLMTLDDDIEVLSGHGPATSIGMERRHNPYL